MNFQRKYRDNAPAQLALRLTVELFQVASVPLAESAEGKFRNQLPWKD